MKEQMVYTLTGTGEQLVNNAIVVAGTKTRHGFILNQFYFYYYFRYIGFHKKEF